MGKSVKEWEEKRKISRSKVQSFKLAFTKELFLIKLRIGVSYVKSDLHRLHKFLAFIGKSILEKAEKELDFALDYWLNKREAIPNKNASKFRSCAYIANCNSKSVFH